MAKCLGYPYCTVQIDPPNVACRACWFIIPKKMRSKVTALIFKNPHSKLRESIFQEATDHLHAVLAKRLEKKVERAVYTVVPYKGKRAKRRSPRRSKEYYKYNKYYGGPWDYQK